MLVVYEARGVRADRRPACGGVDERYLRFYVAYGLDDWCGMITEHELFDLELQLAGMPHVRQRDQRDPVLERVVRPVLGGVDPDVH